MRVVEARTELSSRLEALNACEDAVAWAAGYDSLDAAWSACKRSDWMLWLLPTALTPEEERDARLIAVACARRVQHLMTDDRSREALAVAERYARGEATREELTAAGDAAWDAAWDARAVAWDARAAARATARATAWDAWGAAWFAGAAAALDARDARDARAAAEAAAWAEQSDIIREYWPTPPPSVRARVERTGGGA